MEARPQHGWLVLSDPHGGSGIQRGIQNAKDELWEKPSPETGLEAALLWTVPEQQASPFRGVSS